MDKARLKQQLELLFQTGSGIALEFGTEHTARQELLDANKPADEAAVPPEMPPETRDYRLLYQRWYTCALPVVREAAPDRYAEFRDYYEQRDRKEVDRLYTLHNYFNHAPIELEGPPWLHAMNCLIGQLHIIKAASDRFEWQVLTESLVYSQRDIQLDELSTARRLISFDERAAGAMAALIFERFLQDLAKKHKLKFGNASPPLREITGSLLEAKVLEPDVGQQCAWLAAIHQRCFTKKSKPPSKVQVRDLIDGTRWLIANVF